MNVTIADKLPEQAIQQLETLGLEVNSESQFTQADLDKGLKDTQILIVRSTVVSDLCIQNSPNLSLIIRAGAGVNNIDIKSASSLGIYVANCPGKNAVAVAELTMGLILSLDRFLADNVSDFRKGVWNKAIYSKADGLYGKTLGIVGMGQIGQEVIKRGKAFGLDIVVWSRSLTPEIAEEMDVEYADFISILLTPAPALIIKLRFGLFWIHKSLTTVDLTIKRGKAFGLDIVVWSRSLTPEIAEEMDVEYAESVLDVSKRCDILSVHLALNAETKGIISKEVLAALKDGALFINTSRDNIVDEEALYEELKSGRIRAGLDVFSSEPEGKQGEFTSRFQKLDNVYISHHIGASTEQAQLAVADDAVDIVRGYVQEGFVRNWLNRCEQTEAPWQLVVRHFDKPGVIANVMSELKQAKINAQELTNVIFDGKKTACCTIQIDTKPSDEIMSSIRTRQDEVISATLIAR